MTPDDPLLVATGLVRHYRKPRRMPFAPREIVQAVDGVSFHIRPGETLGLIGESGCGKSTVGRAVAGIDRPSAGSVTFKGVDSTGQSAAQRRRLVRHIQMIFQNPVAALDPRLPLGRQVREPLTIHDIGAVTERGTMVSRMFEAVGLEPDLESRYPHEISGGQAQRAVIARALIMNPKLLICDEPVSALDASVQAQVIDLLADLQARLGLTYLFISHDLKVVKRLCHRVAVMYLGRIVEEGPTDAVFDNPKHPYTKALISAIPTTDQTRRRNRIILQGDPPSALAPPSGCRFHTRCQDAIDICSGQSPVLRGFIHQRAACHVAEETA
jgi:peptide/nickel transport system ATP-binding protein/oligopeptide transport system ATP-binding protein